MRAKRLFLILAGVGAAAAIVGAYRANERRFRALQEEMRELEESRRGEASRPVFVMAAPGAPPASPREAPAVPEAAPAATADESAGPAKGHGITAEEQAAHVGMVLFPGGHRQRVGPADGESHRWVLARPHGELDARQSRVPQDPLQGEPASS